VILSRTFKVFGQMQITAINWLRLGALGFIWGAAFMTTRVALDGLGPFWVMASRVTLGAVFLYILAKLLGRKLPDLRQPEGRVIWGFAILMGIFSNVVPFSLLSWGQQYVASGFAGVTMAAVPLIILPLAYLFVPGEWLSWRRVAGFVMGSIGVVVLIGPDAFQTTGAALEQFARLACLGTAFCYAVGTIFTRLCPKVDLLVLSSATLLVAAFMAVPLAFYTEGVPKLPSGWSLLAFWHGCASRKRAVGHDLGVGLDLARGRA